MFSIPFVALLMPARPALLMPAVGTGFGKPAEGVANIGPPNGPLTGGVVVDGLAVWPCPKADENTVSPAISRIPRGIDHPLTLYLIIGLLKGKQGMPEYFAWPMISATHKTGVQAARDGRVIGPFDDGPPIGEKSHFIGFTPEFQYKSVVLDRAVRAQPR